MSRKRKIGKIEPFEYRVVLDSVKARDKFVKRLERCVRSSLEYKDYISYLKDNMDFSQCAFFPNVNNQEGTKVRIEAHHDPFTLYDICDVVLQKWIDMGFPLVEELIAEEVMELHYRNMVGLIPLSLTMHQLVHPKKITSEQKLFIPIHMIYGNYKEFVKEYADFIGDDLYDKLEKKIEKSKNLTPEDFNAIMKEFEYLEIEGIDRLQKISEECVEVTEETEEVDAA